MGKKEELVENFIEKLINHISTKSSEASQAGACDDSCFGFDGWRTEEELRKSIKEMFDIPIEKDEEDEEDEDK